MGEFKQVKYSVHLLLRRLAIISDNLEEYREKLSVECSVEEYVYNTTIIEMVLKKFLRRCEFSSRLRKDFLAWIKSKDTDSTIKWASLSEGFKSFLNQSKKLINYRFWKSLGVVGIAPYSYIDNVGNTVVVTEYATSDTHTIRFQLIDGTCKEFKYFRVFMNELYEFELKILDITTSSDFRKTSECKYACV